MIAVVDYEMGNVGSVLNMLKRLAIPAKLARDIRELSTAHGVILPGVGAFDRGIAQLKKHGLFSALTDLVVVGKKPCLGICLGMQLMGQGSEEGVSAGLGWIDSRVVMFRRDPERPQLRVPHMGWNFVRASEASHSLIDSLPQLPRFYFVHSYHYPAALSCTVATTHHLLPFTSVLAKENIYGCQFHPEKSHAFGLKLFSNFAKIASGSVVQG
jgi:glutamine amidotransferase